MTPVTTDFGKRVFTELLTQQVDADELRAWLQGIGASAAADATVVEELVSLLQKNSTLLAVGQQISDILSIDVLLNRLAGVCCDAIDAARCTVFVYDRDTDQ